jgi:hypothetical protein
MRVLICGAGAIEPLLIRIRYVTSTTRRDVPPHLSEPKTAPELVRNLRDAMTQLQPTPGSNHATKRLIFLPPDLNKVTHVFLQVDAVQPSLLPQYEGPYAVLEHYKNFKLQRNNGTVLVSIHHLKPASYSGRIP